MLVMPAIEWEKQENQEHKDLWYTQLFLPEKFIYLPAFCPGRDPVPWEYSLA